MPAAFVSSLLIFLTFMAFALKRQMTYLHAYQQEEYDSPRFLAWLWRHGVFDTRLSAILLITGGLAFILPKFMTDLIVLVAFAGIAYFEKDPRTDSKKKLNFTTRARRIYIAALGLSALAGLFVFFTHQPWIWIAVVQALPVLLVLGNALLDPFEKKIQQKYWDEAHDKVVNHEAVVIGITGSFGKTSIKHILGHILKNTAPTLITPGSVNTPMGIARIVREELDDSHKYFIVEMGAYGPGSIARLCALTPPKYAIISAIGHAHYERFKTLDAVAETKFELAQAAMKADGKAIIHEKTLNFEYSSGLHDSHPEAFIVCGEDEGRQVRIKSVEQNLKGLKIKVTWQEETYLLEVPLFGLHHGHNVALCFAMACELGLDPESVATILKSTPQIPHRLEVKPNRKLGSVIIDDAYNSNPMGFRSALDLLHKLGQKRRKILITPGMVELGAAHDDMHRTMGKYAARCVDVCIVVAGERIPTFIDGFKSEATQNQNVLEMPSFSEAQRWMAENMTKEDVILLENDLPDIYERVPRL